MGSIGRYIFRTTMGAFLLILISVTLLMWVTQALRNIDVMTDQGQNFLVFLGITALIIPMLIMIIAPIALLIAIAHVLTKLGNDSELIVMNSAGMAPWQVFRPFLAVGIIVSLGVAAISFYISPKCLREVRRWAAELRAELVSSKVQPGRFTTVEGNLTLHIRDRLANGQLYGVLLDDQRDQKERITIIAERGDLLDNERGTFLVLENGAVHRQEAGQRDPVIVGFTQYAFDLSRLSPPSSIEFSVQERAIEELIWPRPDDATFKRVPGQFRAELYNRLAMPLYPLAFMVVIFAYLGAPRTTRQSRTMSLASAIMAAMAVRTVGFIGAVAGARSTTALLAPFYALAVVFLIGGWIIWRGLIIEPPAFVTNALNTLVEGLTRRKVAHRGAGVMMPGTLARYVGLRFLAVFVIVFGGLFMMTLMIDFVEMLRRTANLKDVSLLQTARITLYRVPHITERTLPFTALVSSMVCYLSLTRRHELVVARAAGVSAWQFVMPSVAIAFLIGVFGTTLYNPISATLREHAQRLDAEMFGGSRSINRAERGFWVRQRSPDGQSIINAKGSRLQGVELSNVTIFTLDHSDRFLGRIEANRATLYEGYWRLEDARIFAEGTPPADHALYDLKTNITRAQAQESFATPETVPFWHLSYFIRFADNAGLAAIGYRLQYYQLLAQPFYLVAMVLLAASVSLRLFRFGGVQKLILGGISVGFLLYVLSKVTGDLSKANLLTPVVAAALPPIVGGLTGLITLLYLEDG